MIDLSRASLSRVAGSDSQPECLLPFPMQPDLGPRVKRPQEPPMVEGDNSDCFPKVGQQEAKET